MRSSPAHSWTPTMPKMKKTKKQRRRTFPSMGRVSNSRVTKIRMPSKEDKKGKEFIRTFSSDLLRYHTWKTDQLCTWRGGYLTTNLYWACQPQNYSPDPTTAINTGDDNTQSDSLTSAHPAGLKVRASRWPALSNCAHSATLCRCHVRSGKVRSTSPGVNRDVLCPF